ncbi:hypothetical protein NMG60_11030776 [Bertholletia excelsa]
MDLIIILTSISSTPPLLYPNPATSQPPSSGAVGTVFIVLGVKLAMAACFFGRLCNRRHHSSHQLSTLRRVGDVESGLGWATPAPKKVSFANGGDPSESKPDSNGEKSRETRSGYEEGLKAGQ